MSNRLRQRTAPVVLTLFLVISMITPPRATLAAAGDLDPDFGMMGLVTTDFLGLENAKGIALQGDGKIVVAGSSDVGVALARYNTDGSLDTTGFNPPDGTLTSPLIEEGNGVALQSDGKIVVVGLFDTGGPPDFGVVRFCSDGSLDDGVNCGTGGFGSMGVVDTVIGSVDIAKAVAIQSDGKIVVAGVSDDDFALARYCPDGSLDDGMTCGGPAFDTDGILTTDIDGTDEGRAIAIQSDGKIVVAGFSGTGVALARYNTDGSLDAGFSPGGSPAGTLTSADIDGGNGVAIQPDGKIVVAGSFFNLVDLDDDFGLVRFCPDGDLDGGVNCGAVGFGSGGVVITDLGDVVDIAYAVAIQEDGRIVVAGESSDFADTSGFPDFALVRYDSDGSPDTTFGTGGAVFVDFSGADDSDSAAAVAIQSDGKIVAAGYSDSADPFNDFALARFDGDSADLSITKTADVETASPGDTVTYTITVTSSGVAGGVMVTDSLPGSVTLVSATPSQGSCTGTTDIVCELGSLADGGTATIIVVVTIDELGEVSNTALVFGQVTDADSSDNSSTVIVEIVENSDAAADLSVIKTVEIDGEASIAVGGDTATYTVTVTNNGPATATGVTLIDSPSGDFEDLSVSAPSGATCSGEDTITCSLGTLADGDSITVTMTLKLTDDVKNEAEVSSEVDDPDPTNNTDSVELVVFGGGGCSLIR